MCVLWWCEAAVMSPFPSAALPHRASLLLLSPLLHFRFGAQELDLGAQNGLKAGIAVPLRFVHADRNPQLILLAPL